MTNDLGERRDLADERDSIEYQAMCDQVQDEAVCAAKLAGIDDYVPDGGAVHLEAIRRLKEKYAQE